MREMSHAHRNPAVQLKSACARWQFGKTHLFSASGCRPAVKKWLHSLPPDLAVVASPVSSKQPDGADGIRRLEAVLFLAREPLSSRKLSHYANLADGTEARTLVRQLNEKLDRVGRAFRIYEVAGGFQLATRPKFAPWLRRLEHVPRQFRISAPGLETLAVIAYRQPVVRSEIESIRGVNCGEVLSQLLDRDLIRISGRSNELGRPYLYQTTKRFLQVFCLRGLDDLPPVNLSEVNRAETLPSTPTVDDEREMCFHQKGNVEEDST
jgi:segregation and condensation protein B